MEEDEQELTKEEFYSLWEAMVTESKHVLAQNGGKDIRFVPAGEER